jgi:hypothetical protein
MMRPDLQDGVFVFCTVARDEDVPATVKPVLLFREGEGTTLVMRREEAEQARLSGQFASRMITLAVHSSLDAVGFLAAVTMRLASAGISVNAVSAYFHDHLFVPVDRADDALRVLEDLSEVPTG